MSSAPPGKLFAIASASADLPTAVGPEITTTFGRAEAAPPCMLKHAALDCRNPGGEENAGEDDEDDATDKCPTVSDKKACADSRLVALL